MYFQIGLGANEANNAPDAPKKIAMRIHWTLTARQAAGT
jgi:hypothetical protein